MFSPTCRTFRPVIVLTQEQIKNDVILLEKNLFFALNVGSCFCDKVNPTIKILTQCDKTSASDHYIEPHMILCQFFEMYLGLPETKRWVSIAVYRNHIKYRQRRTQMTLMYRKKSNTSKS